MKSERAARTLGWSSASDSSLRVRLSNGKTLTFDGFWEREACIELLHACARFVGHTIHVDDDDECHMDKTAGDRSQPTEACDGSGARHDACRDTDRGQAPPEAGTSPAAAPSIEPGREPLVGRIE